MEACDLAKQLEHYVTPRWAVDAILRKEILSPLVIDPCTGTGVLSEAARRAGYLPLPIDIHDWGYPGTCVKDFLSVDRHEIPDREFSVLMNPPFSKATHFVQKAFSLGARKVLCFQRFSWFESRSRKPFFDERPPARVYVCGDRATCWRHDLIGNETQNGTTTAHAWFVFEAGHKGSTILDRIYKGE